MRILDVTSFFSESCGGIKTYYRAKAHLLPRLGADCHFVVPGARREEGPLGGGVLHRIPGPPLPGNPHYRLFGRLGDLCRLIRRLAPDVIEIGSHTVLPAVVARALRGARGGRRPAVVGFFHSDVPRTLIEPVVRWLPRPLGRRLVEVAWRFVRRRHERYDATLVASRAVERLLRQHGVPRVAWVGLGVDVDVFRPDAACPRPRLCGGAPVMVYAGRLSADKSFSLVLGAYDRIHAATGAALRIVGDGPLRQEAERFAASRPGISVDGYLDAPAAVAAALAAADVAITPGARETFSLATAEALACGTPVVGADEGAAPELLAASGGGRTFRAGDAGALAAAAIALLGEERGARREMGARGRAHVVRSLSWSAVMARLLDQYRALVPAVVTP
jgi:alpha-1,6-mannosyltransferase